MFVFFHYRGKTISLELEDEPEYIKCSIVNKSFIPSSVTIHYKLHYKYSHNRNSILLHQDKSPQNPHDDIDLSSFVGQFVIENGRLVFADCTLQLLFAEDSKIKYFRFDMKNNDCSLDAISGKCLLIRIFISLNKRKEIISVTQMRFFIYGVRAFSRFVTASLSYVHLFFC